jgi:murein DD-endopeptidase MepM/ murein hydrolase activator NlpD
MSMQINIPHPQLAKPEATTGAQPSTKATNSKQAETRRAAMEFEAIMLSQLTSALQPAANNDEESLFGSSDNGLAQQMFGEQLATSMAKGGGIGMADLIARQLNPDGNKVASHASPVARMVETVRHLREAANTPPTNEATTTLNPTTPSKLTSPFNPATTGDVTATLKAPATSFDSLNEMVRPRRVADVRPTEPGLHPTAAKDVTTVVIELPAAKAAASPAVEDVKRATITAPSPTPSLNANHVETDPMIGQLQQMSRPRRVTGAFRTDVATASVVKIPKPPITEPVKHAEVAKYAVDVKRVEITARATEAKRAEAVKRAAVADTITPSRASLTGQPKLDALIEQASARHGIDPHLLAAVIRTESVGKQYAVSHKGAQGLMQIMPATFKEFATPGKNAFDPAENINVGAAYLKYLSNRYDGSIDKVLAGYNAGMGNVEKYGGVPPFKETRNFVATVKGHFRNLVAADKASASDTVAASPQAEISPVKSKFSNIRPLPVQPAGGLRAAVAQRSSGATVQTVAYRDQSRTSSARSAQTLGFNDQVRNSPAAVELQSPVEGRISSAFGTHRGRGHQHQGVDIAAPRGTPIEASADGEVVFAGWSHGYGKTVLIKHQDGVFTRYAHADKLMVSRGDTVQSGQKVATVGATGSATGPHLHFEVLQGRQRVNPMNVVAQSSGQKVEVAFQR